MRISEIVRIDSRGRVTLPSSLREAAGLSEGMDVMLIANIEERNTRIIPFADPKAKLYKFCIRIHDAPGRTCKNHYNRVKGLGAFEMTRMEISLGAIGIRTVEISRGR